MTISIKKLRELLAMLDASGRDYIQFDDDGEEAIHLDDRSHRIEMYEWDLQGWKVKERRR